MPEVPSQPRARRPIYLDHHATTPVDPRVAAAVLDVMTMHFGNASSVDHLYGEEAYALVEEAATEVAALVGASDEHIRFTSGATEAIRLAFQIAGFQRTGPLRIAASRAEHSAVLDQIERMERAGTAEVKWLCVDSAGQVALTEIASVLAGGIDLLCLMAANNEVGTLYPVEAAAALSSAAGVELLVDATQAAGLVDIKSNDWGIDYLVLSSHKLYGPKGVGALVGPSVRTGVASEVAGHAGTTNVSGVVGFGLASRIAREGRGDFEDHLRTMRDRLEGSLLADVPGIVVNGDRALRLPHNLHVSIPGAPNHAMVARLRREVAVSTGSACSSGAQEPSHVLRAMMLPEELQETALRISPGRSTTFDDVDRAAEAIIRAATDIRIELKEYA